MNADYFLIEINVATIIPVTVAQSTDDVIEVLNFSDIVFGSEDDPIPNITLTNEILAKKVISTQHHQEHR